MLDWKPYHLHYTAAVLTSIRAARSSHTVYLMQLHAVLIQSPRLFFMYAYLSILSSFTCHASLNKAIFSSQGRI